MTILDPGPEQRTYTPVGDWRPTRFTPSLSGTEEFPTDGDKLVRFAERHWSMPEVERFELDPWQPWLIRHVLERYPDDWPVEHLRGQLRFRQVVISMARQNGKSLLGALFAIYFLVMHVRGPRVIGLASIDRQAQIVYNRVKYAIDNSTAMTRDLRTTETRGIHHRKGGGIYLRLPADPDSAQGEPGSGIVYDELHLGLAALWDAMLLAMKSKENAMMIGITTAGDDDSALLIRLYGEGEVALAGGDERFGFFVWEGADDELTEANVIAASPAIACGRVSLENTMSDATKMWRDKQVGDDGMTGPQRVIRYTLNRMISGAAGAWASATAWAASVGEYVHGDRIVYGIDRTPEWEYATITATSKAAGGRVVSEPIATLVAPDFDQLLDICEALASRGPCTFAMDSKMLGRLADRLKDRGREAWKLGATEMAHASQNTAAKIARRGVIHPGHPLLRVQIARARARAGEDGDRLSRALSLGHIDAVTATAVGVYVATVEEETTIQLF